MHPWAFVAACCTSALLAALVWYNCSMERSGKAVTNFHREFGVALRSAFVYLAMVAPLVWPRLNAVFPANLLSVYCSLPFWYAFLVTTSVGRFVGELRYIAAGTSIALLALVLLNYLMPGGAGPLGKDPDFVRDAWIPGGYTTARAFCFTLLFVYCIFASGLLTASTKKYTLAMFAQTIAQYMDPSQDPDAFRAVLWDWQFQMNWQGPVMCQVYLIGLAVALGAVTLLMSQCSANSGKFHLSTPQVVEGFADLARDTIGCMERLLVHFREASSQQALDSAYVYIRELGARRSAMEALLADAVWESYGAQAETRLGALRKFSGLLRGFRQVLRIQLEHLRGHGDPLLQAPAAQVPADVALQLDIFLVSCRDAMECLADPVRVQGEIDACAREHLARCISYADDALLVALELLQQERVELGGRTTEIAFVDCLRSCTSMIPEFLDDFPGTRVKASMLQSFDSALLVKTSKAFFFSLLEKLRCWPWRPRDLCVANLRGLCGSMDQHLNALRNCTSWVLALLWSIYERSYSSGCVVGVSWIFSATLGSLFDRNINRMVGVGMGLVVGNLPAVLLLKDERDSFGSFIAPIDGFVVYMVMMFFMWTFSMYGYIATGAKYSYACLLWAAFGAIQMLSHLHGMIPSEAFRTDTKEDIYMDMMDNFVACLLVFVVDILFARVCGGLSSEKVATLVPKCLDDVAQVVEGFISGNPAVTDVKTLQGRIASARFWDGEVQKEDLIWSMLWVAPYKTDFIHAILDQCDDIYVAAYSIQQIAQRCGGAVGSIVQQVLSSSDSARARVDARATKAALLENLQAAELELSAECPAETDGGTRAASKNSSSETLSVLTEAPAALARQRSEGFPKTLLPSDVGELRVARRRSFTLDPGDDGCVRHRSITEELGEEDEGRADRRRAITLDLGDERGDLRARTTSKMRALRGLADFVPSARGPADIVPSALQQPLLPPFDPRTAESGAGKDPLGGTDDLQKDCIGGAAAAEAITSVAAEVSIKTAAWSLRLALQRIEVLIQEHAFWASEDWTTAENLRRRRDTDHYAPYTLFQASPLITPRDESDRM